jgi:diguanylate cyclase (GGDEF)-like protein
LNPAFEPTAVLGTHAASEGSLGARILSRRLLLGAAAGLALLALPLSAATAALAVPEGALLICALASAGLLRLAAGAQRRDATAQGLVDSVTGLYNPRGFSQLGAELLEQARREGKPLSLVVFDFSDLMEVRSIYGREVSRKLLARVVRKMETVAGRRGLAARTGKTEFSILLPGAGRDKSKSIIQRALGKPSRIEFDAGDSEIVLVPDIMAEAAAPAVETVDELYREVFRNLAQARAYEKRRQHYLTRERERHSRPMSLPPVFDSLPAAPATGCLPTATR